MMIKRFPRALAMSLGFSLPMLMASVSVAAPEEDTSLLTEAVRNQFNQSLSDLVHDLQMDIVEYYSENGVWPTRDEQVGLSSPLPVDPAWFQSVTLGEQGTIVVRFSHLLGAPDPTLLLIPTESIQGLGSRTSIIRFHCVVQDMKEIFIPSNCEQTRSIRQD